jgi:hypothetical protein
MKKSIIILVAVALTTLVVGGYIYTQKSEGVLGGASVVADTTVYPLYPSGETKQFILDVSNANGAFLDIKMTASTSDSVLNWTYEFTNDTNCGFNANPTTCTWYGEDQFDELLTNAAAIATGLEILQHSTTTLTHTWANSSTIASTTNKRIIVKDINAKFMRTTFSATVATSSITVQQGATN